MQRDTLISNRLDAFGRRDDAGSEGQRARNRFDARYKTLACLALVIVVAWAPPPRVPTEGWEGVSAWHAVAGLLLLVATWRAQISWARLAGRLTRIVIWIVVWAALIPAWHGFARGWGLAAAVCVKGILSTTALLLLVNTTPHQRLLAALARLGAPRILVASLSAMGRYLYVLLDEMERMRRAERARSFGRGVRWRRLALTRAGWLVGMLLVRSACRAERVHAAMLARGFDGRLRTLDECT